MIYLDCGFSTSISRTESEDYIRALDLSVYSYDEDGTKIVLGKFGADLLLLADAQLDGEDIFDICDQDSQGLYEVYEALLQRDAEFQPELEVEDLTDHILFLWDAVLHPKLGPYLEGIIDAIGGLFGHETVIAMWRNTVDFNDKQLAHLGFAKIAGTKLLFRHMARRTPFTEAHPQGLEVPSEFSALEEDEQWVMAEWNRKNPDVMKRGLRSEPNE